jgi:hypothetical protein
LVPEALLRLGRGRAAVRAAAPATPRRGAGGDDGNPAGGALGEAFGSAGISGTVVSGQNGRSVGRSRCCSPIK